MANALELVTDAEPHGRARTVRKSVLVLAGMTQDGFQGDPIVRHFRGRTTSFLQELLGCSTPNELSQRYSYGGSADPSFTPFQISQPQGVRKVCYSGVGPIMAHEARLAGFEADFAPIEDFFSTDEDGTFQVTSHWRKATDAFDVVALSTSFVLKYSSLVSMLSCLAALGKIVIVGGVLVNKMSDVLLWKLPFHYCLKTEAEGRFSLILKHIASAVTSDALQTIPGLLWKEGGATKKSSAPFSLVEFEGCSVYPDREWVRARNGVYQYESVRGCPFRCEFCDYPYLMGNKSFRMKSAEQIFEEWTRLHELGVRHIDALDSLFTVPKKRLKKLAELVVGSGLAKHLTWACYSRVTELADPDFAALMKEAGCRYVFLGVESGSQIILDNMKKLTKVADNERAIRNCNDVGLYTSSGILVGFPGETESTIGETKEFLARASSPSVHIFVWIPDFTENSPVPIMRPDRREKFGIDGGITPRSYVTSVWGESVNFELRTSWTHQTMTQERALSHALSISELLRSDVVKGEDFSFAPYRASIKHPAILAAQMDYTHQYRFVRGWKLLFNDFLGGLPSSDIKLHVPKWLRDSGMQRIQ